MLYYMIRTTWMVLMFIYILKFSKFKGIRVQTKCNLKLADLSDEQKVNLIQEELQRTFPIAIKKLRNQQLIAVILTFIIALISLLMIFVEAILGNSLLSIICSVLVVLYTFECINHARARACMKRVEFEGVEQIKTVQSN